MRSVVWYFISAEMTDGFSPRLNHRGRDAARRLVDVGRLDHARERLLDAFHAPTGKPNCLRMRRVGRRVRAACDLAPAVADDGSEMARPAARHSISMRQPWPTIFSPPMTQSIGMKTSLAPVRAVRERGAGRQMPAADIDAGMVGRDRAPRVMPMSSPLPSRFSGSNRRKARPTSVAFGPSVM